MHMMRKTGSMATRWALAATLLLATGCRGPWSKGWKVSDMWDVDVTPWSEEEPEAGDTAADREHLDRCGAAPRRQDAAARIRRATDLLRHRNEKPVLVDGQLVIYAFDESNREPTNNKPTRRYVFPPDQVARRMSKSELGPSYSFWLPWDEVGGVADRGQPDRAVRAEGGPDRRRRTDAALAARRGGACANRQ